MATAADRGKPPLAHGVATAVGPMSGPQVRSALQKPAVSSATEQRALDAVTQQRYDNFLDRFGTAIPGQ